jgi:hypothetical protein
MPNVIPPQGFAGSRSSAEFGLPPQFKEGNDASRAVTAKTISATSERHRPTDRPAARENGAARRPRRILAWRRGGLEADRC